MDRLFVGLPGICLVEAGVGSLGYGNVGAGWIL